MSHAGNATPFCECRPPWLATRVTGSSAIPSLGFTGVAFRAGWVRLGAQGGFDVLTVGTSFCPVCRFPARDGSLVH